MKTRFIDDLLLEERRIFGVKVKCADVMFLMCAVMLGLWARYSLFPIQSADYRGFLKLWMEDMRSFGGVRDSCNYSAAYLAVMRAITYFSPDTRTDLYALKAVSVFFDLSAAAAAMCIVFSVTSCVRRAFTAAAVILVSPAVLLDGAYWCQCDIIYCSFLLWTLWFLLKDRGAMCGVMFGLALSFKLQAVFMLPFFVIMWLKNRTIKFRHSFIIPIVVLLSIVPAWLMGIRSFEELLMTYAKQANYYPWGSLNYPNIYVLLGEGYRETHHAAEVSRAGLRTAVLLLGITAYNIYMKEFRMTHGALFGLAMLTIAIVVHTLPHMHERYGLMLDVLAAVRACVDTRKLPLFCAMSVISVLCFIPYLIGRSVIPMEYITVANIAVVVYIARDFISEINASPKYF